MRKIETGWFGKNKNYGKKEIIFKNNSYQEEIERVTIDFNSLTERYNILEQDKNVLLVKNEKMKHEFKSLNLYIE